MEDIKEIIHFLAFPSFAERSFSCLVVNGVFDERNRWLPSCGDFLYKYNRILWLLVPAEVHSGNSVRVGAFQRLSARIGPRGQRSQGSREARNRFHA